MKSGADKAEALETAQRTAAEEIGRFSLAYLQVIALLRAATDCADEKDAWLLVDQACELEYATFHQCEVAGQFAQYAELDQEEQPS